MGSAGAPMKLTMPTMVWAPLASMRTSSQAKGGLQVGDHAGEGGHAQFLRGSSASRKPSPRKFSASRVRIIIPPGKRSIHQ